MTGAANAAAVQPRSTPAAVLLAPIRRLARRLWPDPPRRLRMGHLRRLSPVSRLFGADRGRCVDRHYIERFLSLHARDVQGRVLEVEDDTYTRRFGGARVTRADVLHLQGNPKATIVGDLTNLREVDDDTFDAVILTQTLQFVYDLRAALATVHRVLKPGGVLLATMPGITQLSRYDVDRWGEFWHFTSMSARRLAEEAFAPGEVTVQTYGNVLAAASFLYGVSADELRPRELDHHDPDYELVVTVRAMKAVTP